jgi:hypothetical protein
MLCGVSEEIFKHIVNSLLFGNVNEVQVFVLEQQLESPQTALHTLFKLHS